MLPSPPAHLSTLVFDHSPVCILSCRHTNSLMKMLLFAVPFSAPPFLSERYCLSHFKVTTSRKPLTVPMTH